MQLNSQAQAPYLPETDQATVLRLGIAPLAVADWLQADADFAAFHAHKSSVLQNSTERVCLCLPESRSTQARFTNFLLQVLGEHHEAVYSRDQSSLRHLASGLSWSINNNSIDEQLLSRSSRWIQEDICLLEPSGTDYIMTAASVCSPSNWKLEDKIGRTLDTIHAPVPGYEQQLSTRVNRLLAGIKPGKALLRFNWSLQPGNELLWRPDNLPSPEPEELYWRAERQSLLRIPDSEIVVFSIRIYLHSIKKLLLLPGFQQDLQRILSRLPPEQMAYKGLLSKAAECLRTNP